MTHIPSLNKIFNYKTFCYIFWRKKKSAILVTSIHFNGQQSIKCLNFSTDWCILEIRELFFFLNIYLIYLFISYKRNLIQRFFFKLSHIFTFIKKRYDGHHAHSVKSKKGWITVGTQKSLLTYVCCQMLQ